MEGDDKMRVTKYGVWNNKDKRPYMIKEIAFNYNADKCFSSPQNVVDLLKNAFHMADLAEEYVYMLALDGKNNLLGVFEVTHGASCYSYISTKSIYERALLCGANAIILAHNHPSGDPKASSADVDVCKKIKKAGELLDIKLLDFLVIGNPDYISFNTENLLC